MLPTPALSQKLVEIGLPELRGNPDRRNVAAANQSVLGGDGADEIAIEVFRREGAERSGRVAQDGARVQHALIESQRVDEWLERGTRGALGEDAVDLAVNFLILVIGRAHPGLDGHVAVVHQQGRHVADASFAELIEVAADLPFHQPLQTGVQSGVDAAGRAGVGLQDRVREMRSGQRQGGGRAAPAPGVRAGGVRNRSGVSYRARRWRVASRADQNLLCRTPRPALAAGRCGITARVIASPRST